MACRQWDQSVAVKIEMEACLKLDREIKGQTQKQRIKAVLTIMK